MEDWYAQERKFKKVRVKRASANREKSMNRIDRRERKPKEHKALPEYKRIKSKALLVEWIREHKLDEQLDLRLSHKKLIAELDKYYSNKE